MPTYEYPRPSVTVDIVVFTKDTLEILLIQRKNDPFKDYWALPGGFLEMDESLKDSALRELEEETGLKNVELHQIGIFDNPSRDPRGRVITVAYATLIEKKDATIRASSDASQAKWFSVKKIPDLAFDHEEIINQTWLYNLQDLFLI